VTAISYDLIGPRRTIGKWLAAAFLIEVLAILWTSPLVGVAVLAAIAVLAAFVWRFELAITAVACSFYFQAYLGSTGSGSGATKVLGALAVGSWLVDWAVRRRPAIAVPQLLTLVALWLWLIPSSIGAEDRSAAVSDAARWVLYGVMFLLIAQNVMRGGRRLQHSVIALALTGGLAAAAGLAEWVSNHTGGHSSGLIQTPDDYGLLMGCTLPLAVWLALRGPSKLLRVLGGLSSAAVLMAVGASLSRGAMLSVAVAGVWLILSRRVRFRWVAGVAIVALLAGGTAYAVAGNTINQRVERKSYVANENISSRLHYWNIALREAGLNPVTGVGPGNWDVRYTDVGTIYDFGKGVQTTHNTYLNVLAELGLGGLMLFIAYLVQCWMRARMRGVPGSPEDALATAVAASVVVAVVGSAFLTEQFQAPLWVFPALAMGVPLLVRGGRAEAPPER
jgi:putative inorganic carbon (HCO3(-)) transporter